VTVVLLVVTGAMAVGDWVAVQRRLFRVEYVLKPLTMAVLIAAAATADLPVVKWWIVAALTFGLLGDVGLMLSDKSRDKPDPPFLLGLGSFLVGHICYLAAFARYGIHGTSALAGGLVVLGATVVALPKVLAGARKAGGSELAAVVSLYAAMLSAMAVLAVGTNVKATAAGGILFLASDTLIAFERFVGKVRFGSLSVIVTYHAAQVLIVVGLIKTF
jgi:uncharacterized membrane protein YhhN